MGSGHAACLSEFTLGAGYNHQDDFAPETQDNDIINFGLMYGFEEADVSFGYSFNAFGDEALNDSHLFVVSGNIGLLPGSRCWLMCRITPTMPRRAVGS